MTADPQQIEIEAKVTFLERTVEVMQLTLQEQGQLLIKFERRLEELERELHDEDDDGAGGLRPHDDPPPHY